MLTNYTRTAGPRRTAFTLVEMCLVIGIIALLSAILYPVFNRVRQSASRASCQSNLHQIGLAMLQYNQDWDDRFPNGQVAAPSPYLGMGWAGQIYPYTRSTQVLHCPTDPGQFVPPEVPCSYGYNFGLVRIKNNTGAYALVPLPAFSSPSRTVLLFETRRGRVKVGVDEVESGVGNGWVLFGVPSGESPTATQMATGLLAGSSIAAQWQNFNIESAGVAYPAAHFDGSNYLAADGHVTWMRGENVSPGWGANGSKLAQSGANAEGTANGSHALTFSFN